MNQDMLALVSIVTAGATIALGSIGPALGQGRAVAQALDAIARQPDAANQITRTLFVSFLQLCATLVTYFTLFVNADLFDEGVGGDEGA